MEVDNCPNQKRKNSVVYLTQNILSDTQPCQTRQMSPLSITTKNDDNGNNSDTYNPYTSYDTYDPSDDYHTRQYTILKNNLY